MNNGQSINSPKTILVIGGGISGITAAVEAAEVGYEVCLIEKNPYLGGRVIRANQYFPKLCSPYCGLEINFKRIKTNPRIKIFTMAEVENISGAEGNYKVSIKLTPRLVNDNCTACNKCVEACPRNLLVLIPEKSKVYLGCRSKDPAKVVIKACSLGCIACKKCEKECPFEAIKVVDNLAVIDYDKCASCGKCVEVCPRKIIMVAQP